MTYLSVKLIALVVVTVIAVWVWNDAEKLRGRGAKISSPLLWAVLCWLLAMIALPAYLVLRATVWTRQATRSDALDIGDLESQPEPDMTPDRKYAPWMET